MVLGCALPAHHSLVEYSCPPCRLQVCFVLFCSAISGKLGSKQHDQASGKTAWCYRNSALFNFLLYLVESDLLPVLSVEASRSLPLEACAHYDHESCISHAPKICNAIRNLQARCIFPISLAYSSCPIVHSILSPNCCSLVLTLPSSIAFASSTTFLRADLLLVAPGVSSVRREQKLLKSCRMCSKIWSHFASNAISNSRRQVSWSSQCGIRSPCMDQASAVELSL